MRKMLKKLGIVIPSAVLTLLMAVGFSTPAFAYVEPEVKEEPAQVIEEEEPTEEEKIPFTIAGNGEVEDNITDDSSKEFFTVKTKGGNTFFLVIDRARNSENVYMLSMIDEYDLQEFLTDEERNGKEENGNRVCMVIGHGLSLLFFLLSSMCFSPYDSPHKAVQLSRMMVGRATLYQRF